MKWYGYASASVLAIWAASPAQAANLNEILSPDAVEMICGDHVGSFGARVVLEDGSVLEGDITCAMSEPRGEDDSSDGDDDDEHDGDDDDDDDEHDDDDDDDDEHDGDDDDDEHDGEHEGEDDGEGEGEVD